MAENPSSDSNGAQGKAKANSWTRVIKVVSVLLTSVHSHLRDNASLSGTSAKSLVRKRRLQDLELSNRKKISERREKDLNNYLTVSIFSSNPNLLSFAFLSTSIQLEGERKRILARQSGLSSSPAPSPVPSSSQSVAI